MSLSLFLPAQTPDPLAELRRLLMNSLVSAHTKRAYIAAFNEFFTLVTASGRPVSRALLMEYRARMIKRASAPPRSTFDFQRSVSSSLRRAITAFSTSLKPLAS